MRYPVSKPYLGSAEAGELLRAIDDNQITQGRRVERFESEFAEFLDVEHAIMCSSGTSALHLALLALEIGPGDEVLIPSLTFVATMNAVLYVGATPVIIDVDPKTWCIDVAKARAACNEHTVAIIPVHLYGVACAMSAIQKLADDFDLHIVEDAAEALGGAYNGVALGTIGEIGTFSFYGNKVITTGEGGAVVTNDASVAERVRLLRGQAQSTRRYWHEQVGYNYRMSDLHAAVGIAQLSRIDYLLHQRNLVMSWYRQELSGYLAFPRVEDVAPWLFTGLVEKGVIAAALSLGLEQLEIETRSIFIPMNLLPYAPARECPIAEDIYARGISLPTYPEMTKADVQVISLAVITVLERMASNGHATPRVSRAARTARSAGER